MQMLTRLQEMGVQDWCIMVYRTFSMQVWRRGVISSLMFRGIFYSDIQRPTDFGRKYRLAQYQFYIHFGGTRQVCFCWIAFFIIFRVSCIKTNIPRPLEFADTKLFMRDRKKVYEFRMLSDLINLLNFAKVSLELSRTKSRPCNLEIGGRYFS